MDTQRLTLEDIDIAAQYIKDGQLVAFQTETVYGLGADATNEEAVKKIYEAKGRPSDNPLIVHIADRKAVSDYVTTIPEKAAQLMEMFWPGPLTLILPVKKGTLSETVTAGLNTVGIRYPQTEAAQQLIRESGKPIAAPSANTSGKPSPTTAEHVHQDLNGKIAAILDTGETRVGLESTVLDLSTADMPVLLRPGGISREDIEAVIGEIAVANQEAAAEETPRSPGMKYKHYAPDEKVYIVYDGLEEWTKKITELQAAGEKIGLLAHDEILNHFSKKVAATYSLGEKKDAKLASKRLFSGLRAFEDTDATVIIAEAFEKEGLGLAYMNRLEKAAGIHKN